MPNVPPALAAIQQAFQARGMTPMSYFDNRHLQPPGLQDQFNAPPTPPVRQMPALPEPVPQISAGTQQMPPVPPVIPRTQPTQPNVTEYTKLLTPDQTGQNGIDGMLRNVMTGQGGIRNAAPGGQLPGVLGLLGNIKPQDGPQRQFNRSTNRWETPGKRDLGKTGFTMRKPTGTVF